VLPSHVRGGTELQLQQAPAGDDDAGPLLQALCYPTAILSRGTCQYIGVIQVCPLSLLLPCVASNIASAQSICDHDAAVSL